MVTVTFATALAAALASAGAPAGAEVPRQQPVQPAVEGAERALERLLELNAAGRLTAPEGRRLLTGELAGNAAATWGPLPRFDRVAPVGEGRAVARIPAREGVNPDIYLYLRLENGAWAIHALRSLALTGILHELVQQADALPPTLESERTLRNARLTISSDRELIAWFHRHRALLERARTAPDAVATREALVEAGALSASRQDGLLRVTIGGMVDNEVGFLFAGDGDPPPIDPSAFIWIEPVGDGWYLFKTT